MTGQSMDTDLNLGGYSFRAPEETQDLRVGSFWRRQKQSADDTPKSPNYELIYSIPPKKKVATADSNVLSKESNNNNNNNNNNDNHYGQHILSRSPSYDRDSAPSPSQLVIDDEALPSIHCDDSNNNNDHTIDRSDDENRPPKCDCVSLDESFSQGPPSHGLVIDTQQTTCEQMEHCENSHESVVIELNPASYQSFDDDDATTITSIKSSEGFDNYSLRTPDEPRVQMRLKRYPKQLPYDKILAGVVFVMSGFVNPRRAKLRDLAIGMGAKYQAKWSRFCTHLICNFKNTPKYYEVAAENGRIVRELWIQECSMQKQLLDWRYYKLGEYPYPNSEEEVDDDDDNNGVPEKAVTLPPPPPPPPQASLEDDHQLCATN